MAPEAPPHRGRRPSGLDLPLKSSLARSMKFTIQLFLLIAGFFVFSGAGPIDWVFREPSGEVKEFLSRKVRPRTRALYTTEIDLFSGRTELARTWPGLPHTARDNAVSHYLVQAFNRHEADPTDLEGLTRTRAGYLLSSLRTVDPSYNYPVAHRVFAVWRGLGPPKSAFPFAEELATGLATIAAMSGEFVAGTLILVCFSCLLRVGEALGLLWEHVVLPAPGPSPRSAPSSW